MSKSTVLRFSKQKENNENYQHAIEDSCIICYFCLAVFVLYFSLTGNCIEIKNRREKEGSLRGIIQACTCALSLVPPLSRLPLFMNKPAEDTANQNWDILIWLHLEGRIFILKDIYEQFRNKPYILNYTL